MSKIQIISINHHTHRNDDRILFNLSEMKWNKLFDYMSDELGVLGYVKLSTCNRVEIYYECERDVRSKIINKWITYINNKIGIEPSYFDTLYGNAECIKFLHRLSLGMESAILGDDQILSQLKKQFLYAGKHGHLSTLLERAFQSIMRCHKEVCKSTDFRRKKVSLAYHSLKSAQLYFSKEHLKRKKLLIIGAGEMAAQIVKYIDKFKFGSVAITNRTIQTAKILVKNKNISIIDYDQIRCSEYDIIVSCTDVGYSLIDDISGIDYYIDLSIISSTLPTLAIPHLFLEDLQTHISKENKDRFLALPKVYDIIDSHTNQFIDWVTIWLSRKSILTPTNKCILYKRA